MLNVQAGTATIMPPIQAIPTPKFRLNSNLLSLLSLIVLCVMVFTLVFTIADSIAVCKSQQTALNIAQMAYVVAAGGVVTAEAGLMVAFASGNPIAIGIALGVLAVALAAFYTASVALTAATNAYWDCMATEGGG